MFDFAWSELMVIGAVALVVIGPKDLPKALKTAGMLVRRARGMAREFQNSIDDLIRESELDDMRKSMQQATKFDLDQMVSKEVDPQGVLRQGLLPDPAAPEAPKALPPELPSTAKAPEIISAQPVIAEPATALPVAAEPVGAGPEKPHAS
jgi:sec-independent protein translocase protein TatB